MEKVFKFVKGGWLLVIILCLLYIIYTLLFEGYNKDVFLSLVFAVFAGVMYYLNVRRVKMYSEHPPKKNKWFT